MINNDGNTRRVCMTLNEMLDKSGLFIEPHFSSQASDTNSSNRADGLLQMEPEELESSYYRNELLVIARRFTYEEGLLQAVQEICMDIEEAEEDGRIRPIELTDTDIRNKTGQGLVYEGLLVRVLIALASIALESVIDSDTAIEIIKDARIEHIDKLDIVAKLTDIIQYERPITRLLMDIPAEEFVYILGWIPQEYIRCNENLVGYIRNKLDSLSISSSALKKAQLLGIELMPKVALLTLVEFNIIKQCIDASNVDIFRLSDELIQRIHLYDKCVEMIGNLVEEDRVYRAISNDIPFLYNKNQERTDSTYGRHKNKVTSNTLYQMIQLFRIITCHPDIYADIDFLIGQFGMEYIVSRLSSFISLMDRYHDELEESTYGVAAIERISDQSEISMGKVAHCYTASVLITVNSLFEHSPLAIIHTYLLEDSYFLCWMDYIFGKLKGSSKVAQNKQFIVSNHFSMTVLANSRITHGKDGEDTVRQTLRNLGNWESLPKRLKKASLMGIMNDETMAIIDAAYTMWYDYGIKKLFNTNKFKNETKVDIEESITPSLLEAILYSDTDTAIAVAKRNINTVYRRRAKDRKLNYKVLNEIAISDSSLGFMSDDEVEQLVEKYQSQSK